MSMRRRIVPNPILSVALLVLWLLLTRTVSTGYILLGAALAIIAPMATRPLRAPPTPVSRPLVALRYMLRVVADVVRVNIEVAVSIVMWRWRRPRSTFVVIPLELRHPFGLAVLAMVTTVVPGTVWSELAADRSALRLSVWDVGDDEAAFIADYRARYEQPLREIFE